MIDLHTHSTFSDGSLTPEQLAAHAGQLGLTALSLTDHDCTDGIGRFLSACEQSGLQGIAGVEMSAEVERGTMHMLGYFIDHKDPAFQAVLEPIRDGRRFRNKKILGKLNDLGLELTWAEVEGIAGEDVVGRPHFAQALVARGHVKSKQAAFDLYLAKGKLAYVDRFRLTPADAIKAITDAGGLAVLAHPFTLQLGRKELRVQVASLKEAGLRGVEVYYSEHSAALTAQYRDLTDELGLVATGGSDFHGDANPQIALGRGFGSLRIPDSVVADLEALLPSTH